MTGFRRHFQKSFQPFRRFCVVIRLDGKTQYLARAEDIGNRSAACEAIHVVHAERGASVRRLRMFLGYFRHQKQVVIAEYQKKMAVRNRVA